MSFILQPRRSHKPIVRSDSGVNSHNRNSNHQFDGSAREFEAASLSYRKTNPITTITPPEEPKYPFPQNHDGLATSIVHSPTPTFAPFIASASSRGCPRFSPMKKQKTSDCFGPPQSSPDVSASSKSSGSIEINLNAESPDKSETSLSATPTPHQSFALASPWASPQKIPHLSMGKNFFSSIDTESSSASPISLKCRGMMQKLSMNSPQRPSPSLTPVRSSPSHNVQPHLSTLKVPTFSFSPSTNFDTSGVLSSIGTRGASAARALNNDTFVTDDRSSIATSNIGTPQSSTIGSSKSSPFRQPLRGQRTPIRHHRGSSFTMLPPRNNPTGNTSNDFSSTISALYGNPSSQIGNCGGNAKQADTSSPFSASPSPRLVPLTVLSRNGSPVLSSLSKGLKNAASTTTQVPSLSGSDFSDSPYDPSSQTPSLMSSPLMKSLDRVVKEDREKEAAEDRSFERIEALSKTQENSSLLSPNLSTRLLSFTKSQPSPMTNGSYPALPKIKLTPRKYERNFDEKDHASKALDGSPLFLGSDGFSPLSLRPRPGKPPSLTPKTQKDNGLDRIDISSFHKDSDKEDAEMDCLLSGFESHKAASDEAKSISNLSIPQGVPHKMPDTTNAANGEKASLQMPSLWLPPARGHDTRSNSSHLSLTCSDGSFDSPYSPSAGNYQVRDAPMSSITFDCNPKPGSAPMNFRTKSPYSGQLPRPTPMSFNKSRSLLHASSAQDPIQEIIRADAIAEAARSDEPLTDDDSDLEGSDPDFLLCVPQKQLKANRNPSSGMDETKGITRSEDIVRRTESPLFTVAEGFTRQNSHRHTPTLRPLLTPVDGFKKRESSDATFSTFCSLSDCDSSDIMASPKYARKKASSAGPKSYDSDNDNHLLHPKDRASVCSLLSVTSLCGLDIVHETSPFLLPSQSSELLKHGDDTNTINTGFKPLQSELSLNSLGLSVDSTTESGPEQRDLITPPVTMGCRNSRQMLSPPPLRKRAT